MFFSENPSIFQSVSNPNPSPEKSVDRRFLPRWEVRSQVFYKCEGDIFESECFSKDINAVGACISTKDKIPSGQKISVRFYLGKNIDPVCAAGMVKWSTPARDQNYIGIHFDQIQSKSQDIIFQYAFEHKKKELQKIWFQGVDPSPSLKPLSE